MGYCLNIGADFCSASLKLVQTVSQLESRLWWTLLQCIEFNSQQRDPLIDIVVEFPRDARTFLLLRINQPATHAGKSFLRQLAIRNVYARAGVACKRAVIIKSGYASIQHPSIVPIVAAHP